MINIVMIIICIAPLIYLLIHQFIEMKTELKEWELYLKKEEATNERDELKKQIEINETELEENELKVHLQSLTKEQIIELYLQKRFEAQFIRSEERSIICSEIRDALYILSNQYNGDLFHINDFWEILEQIQSKISKKHKPRKKDK